MSEWSCTYPNCHSDNAKAIGKVDDHWDGQAGCSTHIPRMYRSLNGEINYLPMFNDNEPTEYPELDTDFVCEDAECPCNQPETSGVDVEMDDSETDQIFVVVAAPHNRRVTVTVDPVQDNQYPY